MDCRIPPEVQHLLEKYLRLINSEIGYKVYGIYIYGSLALGSYNKNISDIDFLTVVTKKLSDKELERVKRVHRQLGKISPYAVKLEGEYVDLQDTRKGKPDKYYPYFALGKFQGHTDIKNIAWLQLMQHGISFYGEDFSSISCDLSWTDIKEELGSSLNDYWAGMSKRLYTLMLDKWVASVVLTLCLIYYNLENESLASKLDAAEFALKNMDSEWHRLIEEAVNIQSGLKKPSLFTSVKQRSKKAGEFVTHMVNLCNSKYQFEAKNQNNKLKQNDILMLE